VVEDGFSEVVYLITTGEYYLKEFGDVSELDETDYDDNERIDLVDGVKCFSKELAWIFTRLNRNYRMKNFFLNPVLQWCEMMENEYNNYDLRYDKYKLNYYHRYI
jgi:hypothetical protein